MRKFVEKPMPDFDKLLTESDARRKARFLEFLHAARQYNKIWRACGGDAKTYLELTNNKSSLVSR